MGETTRHRSRQFFLVGGSVLVAGFFSIFAAAIGAFSLPSIGDGSAYTVRSSTILAADGQPLTSLHGEIDRKPVPLERVPQHVRDAVIAIEDRRFHDHNGFDLRGIARAALNNLRSDGRLEGGSTLSQQFVKNVYFPNQPRTLWRKGLEALITFGVEASMNKDEILEEYLNTVYLGRGVYGVQAAAASYFGKDVAELTHAEGAYLAGLIHAPTHYDWQIADGPEDTLDKKRAALDRRDVVLREMADIGAITHAQARSAATEDLEVREPSLLRWQHPYFVDSVLRQMGVLGRHQSDRFAFLGENASERARTVYREGLRIETTLDLEAQRAAESALRRTLPEMDRLSGALVAIDPENGHVRAMVGGLGYYPTDCEEASSRSARCEHAKVNLALGRLGGGSGRQAGSAFKPITLAAALEDGMSLRQVVESSPFRHDGGVDGTWEVQNYDGSGGGQVDVVEATVRSINAAYARLVVEGLGDGNGVAGAAKVASVARDLGFDFPTEDELREVCGGDYGRTGACTPADAVPAITLGVKEIAPIDLAAAYATFAAEGVYNEPTTITRITDASGEVLYEAEPQSRRAIDRTTALGVTHTLQKAMEEGTGRAAVLDQHIAAGKTGTSQAWRDAWFAGYTQDLAAAIWVGNPRPVETSSGWVVESMVTSNGYPRRVVGGSYPAMTWKSFMEEALRGRASRPFPEAPEELFADPEDPYADEIDVGGGGHVTATFDLRRQGFNVIRRTACPPEGGTDGIEVWKTEQLDDSTVVLWVSRAVC